MEEKQFFKIRLFFTLVVTLAIASLLAWNHFHGGVPSHHVLAREDLPAFSNWWGMLLLPLLSWLLLFRLQSRLFAECEGGKTIAFPKNSVYGFVGALFFGVLLATFFTLGLEDFSGYMVNLLFLIALFFPIYRAECLLGFIIGMTFTFGAVLPLGIGLVFSIIGLVLFRLVRPAILFIVSKITRPIPSNNDK